MKLTILTWTITLSLSISVSINSSLRIFAFTTKRKSSCVFKEISLGSSKNIFLVTILFIAQRNDDDDYNGQSHNNKKSKFSFLLSTEWLKGLVFFFVSYVISSFFHSFLCVLYLSREREKKECFLTTSESNCVEKGRHTYMKKLPLPDRSHVKRNIYFLFCRWVGNNRGSDEEWMARQYFYFTVNACKLCSPIMNLSSLFLIRHTQTYLEKKKNIFEQLQ